MRSSNQPGPTLGGDEWMQDIEHMKKSLMMVLDKDVARLRPMSAPPKKAAYKKKKRSNSTKFKNLDERTRLERDIDYRHKLVRLGIPISNLLDYCVGKAEPTTATCKKDPRIEIIRLMHKRQDRLGLRESRRVLKNHIRKRRGNIKIVQDFVDDLECLIARQSKKLSTMCNRRGFPYLESEDPIMSSSPIKSKKNDIEDVPSCAKIELMKKRIQELKKFDKQLTDNLHPGKGRTGRSVNDIEMEEMQLREDLEDVVGRRTEVEMRMSNKLVKIQEQKKQLEEEIGKIRSEKKKLKMDILEYQDVKKGLHIRIEELQSKSTGRVIDYVTS